MTYTFTPKNTCATKIEFELEGNVVRNVRFTNGCSGNLSAISVLAEGMTVDEIKTKLKGIICKSARTTSCADQFAEAVLQAFASTPSLRQCE